MLDKLESENQEPFRRDVEQDLWAWPIEQILITDEEVIEWVKLLEGMIGDD